jgi:glutathione S-transferase
MLTLYHSPTSPYVRKVLILAHEAGLSDRIETVFGGGSPIEPNAATAAVNPLNKVPCLARPDGPAIFDSRVICQYLDSLHGGHRFYPDGPARWTAMTLEALGDGILDAAILALYETRLRPEAIRFAPWVDGQKRKITQALDAVESQWLAHLSGPVTIGSIAVAVACGYLDLRFADMGWRDTRPNLAAWHAKFAERESYKATVPVV